MHLRHIETYLETKYGQFLLSSSKCHFWKNTKAIVHGSFKNRSFRGRWRNRTVSMSRMYVYMSWICIPKLRVVARLVLLKPIDLYLAFIVWECWLITHLTVGKLSQLWLSFLLCNYVSYRHMFRQSIENFYYLRENAIFWKNTKAIVHGSVKIGVSAVGDGIESFSG